MKRILPFLQLLRLHQPVGFWLLFWPCAWGLALAGQGANIQWLLMFLMGSIAMRGCGCIVNDLWDKNIDTKVKRTRKRPLASGVVSVRQAIILACIAALVGLWVWMNLSSLAQMISLFAVVLFVLYPLAKRRFPMPQLVLGITFNLGVLIAFTTFTGVVNVPALMVYLAGVLWTLGYDTIYAFQDIKADTKMKLHSTAIRWQKEPQLAIGLCYAGALLCILSVRHGMGDMLLLLPAALLLGWQVWTLQVSNPGNCLKRFKSNIWVGALVFIGLWVASPVHMIP